MQFLTNLLGGKQEPEDEVDQWTEEASASTAVVGQQTAVFLTPRRAALMLPYFHLEDLARLSMVSLKYNSKFRSPGVQKWCLRHCGVGAAWRLQYWRKVLDVYHVRAEILMKNHELSSTGFFLACVHGDQSKAVADGVCHTSGTKQLLTSGQARTRERARPPHSNARYNA